MIEQCESVIEKDLWHGVMKHLNKDAAGFFPQAWAETICGKFRVDFALVFDDKAIAVECDGAEFHDNARDEFRDAALLGGGHFAEVVRFKGADLVHHFDDCVYVLARIVPGAFRDRDRQAIKLKASKEAIETDEEPSGFWIPTDGGHRIHVGRRVAAAAGPQHWRAVYRFIRRHPGMNIDQLVQAWNARPFNS